MVRVGFGHGSLPQRSARRLRPISFAFSATAGGGRMALEAGLGPFAGVGRIKMHILGWGDGSGGRSNQRFGFTVPCLFLG